MATSEGRIPKIKGRTRVEGRVVVKMSVDCVEFTFLSVGSLLFEMDMGLADCGSS